MLKTRLVAPALEGSGPLSGGSLASLGRLVNAPGRLLDASLVVPSGIWWLLAGSTAVPSGRECKAAPEPSAIQGNPAQFRAAQPRLKSNHQL